MRKRLQESAIWFSYCWKRLLGSGVVCAGGSDAPIETCNPFRGMYDAIYRYKPDHLEGVFLPEERLTFDEALALYTKGGAFAAMAENTLGQIAPGFCTEFVVLRSDVTQDHSALMSSNLVSSVWVNGKQTYQSKSHLAVAIESQPDFNNSVFLPGKNGHLRLCQCWPAVIFSAKRVERAHFAGIVTSFS